MQSWDLVHYNLYVRTFAQVKPSGGNINGKLRSLQSRSGSTLFTSSWYSCTELSSTHTTEFASVRWEDACIKLRIMWKMIVCTRWVIYSHEHNTVRTNVRFMKIKDTTVTLFLQIGSEIVQPFCCGLNTFNCYTCTSISPRGQSQNTCLHSYLLGNEKKLTLATEDNACTYVRRLFVGTHTRGTSSSQDGPTTSTQHTSQD